MVFELFRDDKKERLATKPTKRVRRIMDSVGAAWGLGTFPNVCTDYKATSEYGTVHVAVLSDNGQLLSVTLWPERDLTFGDMERIVRDGIKVSGALKGEESEDQQDQ